MNSLLQNLFQKFIKQKKFEENKYQGFSDAAICLFNALEKKGEAKVKDFLIKDFKGLPVSKEDGLASPSLIDNYFLQCEAGRALKSRLITIKEQLNKIINEYSRKNGKILIGNFGSGPGRDVINVLSSCHNNGNIKAIHIDKDVNSLKRGKRMAMNMGVGQHIEFVKESFLKYETEKKFDIILLIGIICPLNIENSVVVLQKIKKFLKEDGVIIASTATKKMGAEDPFTYYLMKWAADWEMFFKDEADLKKIYENAGYQWKGQFTEPLGFHMMGMGKPFVNE
ncbi:MAG: hypothetical protein Athens101410_638 [Parcubacteria group bacterium Athens1014_10]|nr:MAG: hypothetical protein Athens101410_638 [Parcubacteria group bacterium Athens1014_10]